MKRYFGFIMAAIVAMLLAGCGSKGSSAPAPTGVKVMAKDSRVIVTWDVVPGVDYWIFHAPGTGITPQNCSSMSVLCATTTNASSPTVFSGLINGTTYSFTINGRIDGGPGGPGSASLPAIPTLAGATWTTPLTNPVSTTTALRGVAYGVSSASSASVAKFVAAGDNGALYSGTVYTTPDATNVVSTGITWSPLTNPSTATLNAVSYDAFGTKYMAAGSGGTILQSTDAVTWTLQTTATTNTGNDLYAVANNGAGTYVATGANGTIITSLDSGASWTAQTVSGLPTLNSVAYGSVATLGARFMAAGAAGTVILSQDGVTWSNATASLPSPISSSEVKGVTYGLVANVGTFVVVTADGYATSSSDGGSTWTPPVQVSSAALNAVTASLNGVLPLSTTVTTVTNAFVAVDNAGNIWRSTDGAASWGATPVYAGSTPLYAVTHGGLYDYTAVGASGTNLYAD